MTSRIRKSQRPPKACIYCTSKKIKCNKQIPCQTCVSRHIADSCRREAVIVGKKIFNIEVKQEDNSMDASNNNEEDDNEKAMLHREIASLRRKIAILEGKAEGSLSHHNNDKLHTNDIILATRNLLPKRPSPGQGQGQGSGSSTGPTNVQQVDEELDWELQRTHCISMLKNSKLTSSAIYINAIVKHALYNFNFLHCALLPQLFERDVLTRFEVSHLQDYELQRDRDEFLNLGIICALMSCGILYADTNVMNQLKGTELDSSDFQNNLLRSFSKKFFLLAINYLNRARYMEFPNLKSIQLVLILNCVFHNLSGVNLQNFLLDGMIYTARTLGLNDIKAKQDDETFAEYQLRLRIWFMLVVNDKIEIYGGRVPAIGDHSYDTPIPGNYSDFELCQQYNDHTQARDYKLEDQFVESISYQFFVMKLLEIRIEFQRLKNIDQCNKRFDLLSSFLKQSYQNSLLRTSGNKINLKFQKTAIMGFILNQQLNMNKLLKDEMDYARCYSLATQLIELVLDPEIPIEWKRIWPISHQLIIGCSFFLLDSYQNEHHQLRGHDKFYQCLRLLQELSKFGLVAQKAKIILENLMRLNGLELEEGVMKEAGGRGGGCPIAMPAAAAAAAAPAAEQDLATAQAAAASQNVQTQNIQPIEIPSTIQLPIFSIDMMEQYFDISLLTEHDLLSSYSIS